MKHGFIRAAAATPKIRLADCGYNAGRIIESVKKADERQVELLVFPELCLTGYTCGDLFFQKTLVDEAWIGLMKIVAETVGTNVIFVVGLPIRRGVHLYNCAAVIFNGKIIGIVPKTYIPNNDEFYEKRHFSVFMESDFINIGEERIPFGANILFQSESKPEFVFGIEICEDLWMPKAPSVEHALAGANIIANLSASNEAGEKHTFRRELVTSQSFRLLCGYIYACSGEGESTTDMVFPAHNMIADCGELLAEAERFKNQTVYADIDLLSIEARRLKNTAFKSISGKHTTVTFNQRDTQCEVERKFSRRPFVPDSKTTLRDTLAMQALGLKGRLEHIGCSSVVLGLSGGLDSTLALMAVAETFDLMGLGRTNIHTLSLPCFGTSGRTYNNARKLSEAFGTTYKEINIAESVRLHFRDIGHDETQCDLTFENAQARERTQVLMDYASRVGGLVIGTGDLSELALGFATYNGDHMSMYSVNSSVPKTLIRSVVRDYAENRCSMEVKELLLDILDTPISPELLPADAGVQATEEIVGPYELHDFFLYHMVHCGNGPERIYYLAARVFTEYPKETILQRLREFYARFFAQQYKRSCMPDGPKVTAVSLSPRGDWRMPSDACVKGWMNRLDAISED